MFSSTHLGIDTEEQSSLILQESVRIASWAPASPRGHTNSAKRPMIQVTLNQGAGILMQFIMVILPLLQDLEVEHVSSRRSIPELRSIVRKLRRPERKRPGDQCGNRRPSGNLGNVSEVRRSDQRSDRRPEARKLVRGSETGSEIGDRRS